MGTLIEGASIYPRVDSACLDTFERKGFDAPHSGMNKFDGPGSSNFQLVKDAIRRVADGASTVLSRRANRKLRSASTSRISS
ncbi:hypothetical protein GQ53DRAFT_747785 [Thozetella sp. PMI_491]|nr:hypothetical protein GQ53DRAFT_747785 [Thozetella sp. PMI_491]